mgnify:CR=1 FL=1
MLALLLDLLAKHPADFFGVDHMGAAAWLDIDSGNFNYAHRALDHGRSYRLGAYSEAGIDRVFT